jgi:hypothetical protein
VNYLANGKMTLFEYNNLDFNDRYNFLFAKREDNYVRFNCLRDDGEYKYSLWDCGSFFVELCALNGKAVKVEGIELTDDRINLYIDFVKGMKSEIE